MYITLPPYYPPLTLSYRAKAKKRGFSALFALPLCRPLRCSSSPLRALSPSPSPPFAPRLRVSPVCCCAIMPFPTAAVALCPSFASLKTGKRTLQRVLRGTPSPSLAKTAARYRRGRPHTPLPPPYGPRGGANYLPAYFFIFYFLFSIPPHFYFYFSPLRLSF